MQTATERFQNISAILRELNQAGLKMQTVNDLLTMYVGAASQHALRTTFERSASITRSCSTGHSSQAETSPSHYSASPYVWADSGWAPRYSDTLLPHGRPGNQSSPPFMEATGSPDMDSLFASTPILRGQLQQLQTTLAQQMNAPSLLLKSPGAALRTHGSQKALVKTIQQTTHQQFLANL